MSERCDVAVVGAGLAGLSLASRLHAVGATVRVFEARDRVGGRAFTQTIAGASFDLGGQWAGPSQSRLAELCQKLGVERYPQYATGAKVIETNGRLRQYRGTIPSLGIVGLLEIEMGLRRLDSMSRRVPLDGPARADRAAEWDATTVAGFAERHLRHDRARAAFDTAVRVVFGAEPHELSLLYFLFYLNSAGGFRKLVEVAGGAQELRLVGGAQGLAEGLARQLDGLVELATPVRRIEQRSDEVILESDHGRFAARFAVVAVPPQVARRIRFDPPLPALREQLLDRWAMGATVKIVVVYEDASWRARGLSGEALSTGGPVSCAFDATSRDGEVPALVAFVVGDQARRFVALDAKKRREQVVAQLERLLGAPRRAVVAYVEQDWASEPFTGGCPVATLPMKGLTAFAEVWRAPTGRVHWAGTETARHWNGYLEGALESAERVGSEVLACL